MAQPPRLWRLPRLPADPSRAPVPSARPAPLGWQGRWDELPGKFNRDAIETLMTGWKFWVPASMVNFSMVPLQYRVAYMSTCAIFWNFYLSLASNK